MFASIGLHGSLLYLAVVAFSSPTVQAVLSLGCTLETYVLQCPAATPEARQEISVMIFQIQKSLAQKLVLHKIKTCLSQ